MKHQNKLAVKIQGSRQYKDMLDTWQKALEHQWKDLMLSGLLNSVFDNYHRFIQQPKNGKPIKLRKAYNPLKGTITDASDFHDAKRDKKSGNKIILPAVAISMAALTAWLAKQIKNKQKSVASYYSLQPAMQGYLKYVANVSGQEIIDQIPTAKEVVFRLSNADYIQQINDRIAQVVQSVNDTTTTRMVNVIARGIARGDTKEQMVSDLTNYGEDLAESRSQMVMDTETTAQSEYMASETASMNGFETKTWDACGPNPCPYCLDLDTQQQPIDDPFVGNDGGELDSPPAHENCFCDVGYTSGDMSNYEDMVEASAHNLLDKLDFMKKKVEDDPWKYQTKQNRPVKIMNSEAVWAGGESLLGKDKQVGNYYHAIVSEPNYKQRAMEALKSQDGEMELDKTNFYAFNKVAATLQEARKTLTDRGFIQLLLSLGVTQKIPLKKVTNKS